MENKNNIFILLNTLKEHSNFLFLKDAILANQNILKKSKQLAKTNIQDVSFKDNWLFDENYKKLYFDDASWKLIRNFIIQEQNYKHHVGPYDVHVQYKKLIKTLENVFINIKKSKHTYLQHFNFDPHYISLAISKQIQNVLLSHMQKSSKKYNLQKLYIKKTQMSSAIGNTLLVAFIEARLPLLFNFFVKRNIILKTTEKDLLDTLCMAIIENDILQIKYIYNNEFKCKSTFIIKAINLYILNFLYKNLDTYFLNLHKTYYMLQQKKDLQLSFINCNFRLQEIFIKIGDPILNHLKESNVLDIINYKTEEELKYAYCIIFKEDLIISMLQSQSYRIPFLNVNNMLVERDNDILNFAEGIHITFDNSPIRLHKDFHTTQNYAVFWKKEHFISELSIDSGFLFHFLQYIAPFLGKKYNEISKASLQTFFNLFHVEFDKEFCFDSISDKILSTKLIEITLDFNCIYSAEYIQLLNEQKIPSTKKKYKRLYSHLMSYKFFLIGLLRNSIVFSSFGYFIANYFLDSRGRVYQEGFFLNIQAFPMTRAFIKFFDPAKNTLSTKFDDIKNTILSTLISPISIRELQNLNIDSFVNINQSIMFNHLLNNLKNMPKDLLISLIKNNPTIDNIFDIVLQNIRKPFEWLNTVSLLYRLINPSDYITDVLGLDASSSGLQMISIVFRLKDLAILSNITGNTKTDIYNIPAEILRKDLCVLQDLLNNLNITYKCNLVITEQKTIQKNIDNSISTRELLELLVSFNLQYASYTFIEICKILANRLKSDYDAFRIQHSHFDFLNIIPSSNERRRLQHCILLLPKISSNFIAWLFSIRNAAVFFSTLEIFELSYKSFDRTFFKNAVMTYNYNATSFGRRREFCALIRTTSSKKDLLTKKSLNFIAGVLENFFNSFKNQYLDSGERLRQLSTIISFTNSDVQIDTPFLNVKFRPYETIKKTIATKNMLTNKREFQLVVQVPKIKGQQLIINKKKMKQKFGPNFIHTIDAMIAHIFHEKVITINTTLKEKNIFINFFINHDKFCLTLDALTRILVLDCYYQAYELDFLRKIANNFNPKVKDLILSLQETSSSNNYLTKDMLNGKYFIKE